MQNQADKAQLYVLFLFAALQNQAVRAQLYILFLFSTLVVLYTHMTRFVSENERTPWARLDVLVRNCDRNCG